MLVEQLAFLAWALPVASLVNPRLIKPNYFTISAKQKYWSPVSRSLSTLNWQQRPRWRHSRITRHASSHIQELGGNRRSAATEEPPSAGALVADLLQCFQGEFDNYDQVVNDRAAGLTPGPGGGHEHIHCSLKLLDESLLPEQILRPRSQHRRVPTGSCAIEGGEGGVVYEGQQGERPLAVVAAKYFFNGDAAIVFRYRLYSFHRCPDGANKERGNLMMRLWRLIPSVESRLRAAGYDLADFRWQQDEAHDEVRKLSLEDGKDSAAEVITGGLNGVRSEVAECMHGCEIYWSRGGLASTLENNPVVATQQHDGVKESDVDPSFVNDHGAAVAASAREDECAFVGLMGKDDEGTWVASQNVQGLDILIKDDLKVWRDRLWVNDRGFDRDGKFVYGNQRGVPYKLARVDPNDGNDPLRWTLGKEHRTPELYARKMADIGVFPGQRFGPPPSGVPRGEKGR